MTRITRIIVAALIVLPFHLNAAEEQTPNSLAPITDDHFGAVLVTDEGILVADIDGA